MSNFTRKTLHPKSLTWEDADWLDDYFGSHQYGVRFPDGCVYNAQTYRELFAKHDN